MRMKKKQQIGTILLVTLILVIVASGCKKDDDDSIVKDGDGNIYQTVTIGTQVWLKENLKTTKYNDGSSMHLITDKTEWRNAISEAYCWFDNDITNKESFGALYNWYAVNTGKLCPKGWHVPTDTEWAELITFLGGKSVAGGKLKATGTIEGGNGLWHHPNVATNETGFSALPGGFRQETGSYDFNGKNWAGFWWTSNEYSSNTIHSFQMNYDESSIEYGYLGSSKNLGFSVRCLKD